RRALPDTKILVGGPHISSMGPETLERFPEFDVAVVGEGEWALVHLLDALHESRSLADVQSLLIREGDAIVATPGAPILTDLDTLPLPAWDLLAGFPHAYRQSVFDFPRGPVATIAASRGR